MQPVGIALIGSGFIAGYHARGLTGLPGVQVKAVCSRRRSVAEQFAAEHGIPLVTDTVGDLLERDDIQAVVISTPNKFHAPYSCDFLRHGKDVLVEKPMAMNAEQGREMMRCAQEHARILMVGHMWRFDDHVNSLREQIRAGTLGQIVKTKGYGVHVDWGPAGWFVEHELSGGGALADMGIHAIDTVRYLLGDPLPREVYAKINTSFGSYDVDDTGMVMITWQTGTVSLIESGWWHPHADGPEASTQLFGTRGYASLFPTLIKRKVGDSWEEFSPSCAPRQEHCDQAMYTRQMEHFVQCVRSRAQPAVGGLQGLVNLQIIDAAYESARTGQAVMLGSRRSEGCDSVEMSEDKKMG